MGPLAAGGCARLIQAHPATLVTRGDLTSPQALLAIGTLFLIATLLSRGIRAGILIGIVAAIGGALAGTSTVTTYIESAAGIAAGGRSGLTAVVTGVLFLIALPAAFFATSIPAAVVAAALIIIGATTVGLAREIDWDNIDTAVPAILIMAGMPLTFSIADGLAMGLIAFSALKILRGRSGEVSWLVHVLAALFLVRYVFLG